MVTYCMYLSLFSPQWIYVGTLKVLGVLASEVAVWMKLRWLIFKEL